MSSSPHQPTGDTPCVATKRFRILVAGIHWPPETFLERMIKGLAEAGVEVTIGCTTRPSLMKTSMHWLRTHSWDAPLIVRLVNLVREGLRACMNGPSDFRMFAPFIRHQKGIVRRLRAWNQLLPYAGRRWDLIYIPWNSVSIALLPVFDLSAPVVISCRGSQVSVSPHNPGKPDLRSALGETFRRAAAVHCVSEATLNDAIELGLDPVKARVIRPAVDPEYFRPASPQRKRDGCFRVVTTGTLIWTKGHEWALSAVRRMADRGVDVRYEIIGDGPDRQRVLYTIADLCLQDRVRLSGKLPPDQVLNRLQTADAFLLSSVSEGISNAVLEAMSCGVPVVTTDCGGMREAVTDGVEGFIVPVREASAIAEALGRLEADPAMAKRMGAAARARIQRDFALNDQIGHWLRLFQWILGAKSPPRVA